MPIAYDDLGRIKKPGKKTEFTQEMLIEYAKCIQDPQYFAEQYYKVVHQLEGAQIIKLRSYQKRILTNYLKENLNILMASRQVGKCVQANTLVYIRNKYTKKIETIEIGKLFLMIKKELVKNNIIDV
jgi:hypothetical protein